MDAGTPILSNIVTLQVAGLKYKIFNQYDNETTKRQF